MTRYRAIFIAKDGTEYVLAQGAPSEAAAVEAALAEARRHDLIGAGWPRVTEDDLLAGLRVEADEDDQIYVINPWTGAWVAIDPADVTQDRLEAMAPLMDDVAREAAHSEHPDDPVAFWRRYVDLVGPEKAGSVWFS